MIQQAGYLPKRQRGIKGSYPPAHYVLNRWPHSLPQFEYKARQKAGKSHIIRLFLSAGGAVPKSGHLNPAALYPNQLKQLADQVSQHRHRAHYHTPQHSYQVMMAVGLLGAASGLKSAEMSLLMLAALIHDLDHLGRYQSPEKAGQEKWSLRKAFGILSRSGLHYRTRGDLERLILATCPDLTADLLSKSSAKLARLLVDADLFGSLFFSQKTVRQLTQALKHENRLATDWTLLLSGFLDKAKQIHPASAAAQKLHNTRLDGYSYFGNANLAKTGGGKGSTQHE
ncbi:MAG: HD domain-containing protein [Candidatus Puniceispirillaceae bacterium]